MANEREDTERVLGIIEATLEHDGFDVEWIDYDAEHDAIVVQYATVVGGVEEIEHVLATDIPKTMGAFQGPFVDGDADPYTEMVVLAVNSRTEPADRTGKLRWEIAWEWLPGTTDVSPAEYAEPLQRVLSTAVVVDEAGTHDVDTAFEFTDL